MASDIYYLPIVEQYGVTQFPPLLVVGEGGTEHSIFEGKSSSANILNFLDPFAGPKPQQQQKQGGKV